MKRHQSRLAPTVLTLSLLGSLSLLTACGGGGGDDPAPAAPAAESKPVEVVKVPDPTVETSTAADEPYLVAQSYAIFNPEFDPTPEAFQLNILDGKTQKLKKAISVSRELFDEWRILGQWKEANRLLSDGKTSVIDIADSAPNNLFYLNKTETGTALFHVNLNRGSDLIPRQVSNVQDACKLEDYYTVASKLLKAVTPAVADEPEVALILRTAGDDGDCATTEDNTLKVVLSTYADTVAPKTLVKPNARIVTRVSEGTALKGFIIEDATDKPERKKMSMLNVTMSEVVMDAIPFKLGADAPTQTSYLASGYPLGAQQLGFDPTDNGARFIRIQGTSNAQILRLKWNEKTSLVETSYLQTLTGTSAAVGSIADSKYIYFAFNNVAYRGPVAGASKPFELLYNLGSNDGIVKNVPLVPKFQNDGYVVFTQNEPATVAWAVPKTPGVGHKVVQSSPLSPIKIIGQRDDSLVVLAKEEPFDKDGYGVALVDFNYANAPLRFNDLHNTELVSVVWSPFRLLGDRVDTVIVKPKTGFTLHALNLNTLKGNTELGTLDADFADSYEVTTTDTALTGKNSFVNVKMVLYGNVVTRMNPWLFHPSIPNSLVQIDTFGSD